MVGAYARVQKDSPAAGTITCPVSSLTMYFTVTRTQPGPGQYRIRTIMVVIWFCDPVLTPAAVSVTLVTHYTDSACSGLPLERVAFPVEANRFGLDDRKSPRPFLSSRYTSSVKWFSRFRRCDRGGIDLRATECVITNFTGFFLAVLGFLFPFVLVVGIPVQQAPIIVG